MSFSLDTSVVVRLLVGEPQTEHAKALARLRKEFGKGQRVYVTDIVILEAYHAAKHHYGIDQDTICRQLFAMLQSGVVAPEPGSGAIAALSEKSKAGLVDRLIHQRHRELQSTTLTFDKAQAGLVGAELLR